MNANDAVQYIGLPYKEDGFGPEAFNCWGLLVHIQKVHFGRSMPLSPVSDKERMLQDAKNLLQTREWVQVDEPEHGDCVLMREGNAAHVGIYLDLDNGGVLHSLEGVGVVYTYKLHLGREGFARPKYYRHNEQR